MDDELSNHRNTYISNIVYKAKALSRRRNSAWLVLAVLIAVLLLITKKIFNSMAREQISRSVFIAIDAHVDHCLVTSERKEQNEKFKMFENDLGLKPIKITPFTAVFLYTQNLKPVVIKRVIFREDSPSQEDSISRIVQHKHIMKTYTTFRSRFVNRNKERQTILWMISEYLTHRLSQRYVSRDESIIRSVMGDVLLGLEYLHSMNVAHLDIKIENIMGKEINGMVRYKLIDLGYGRFLDNDIGGRERSETYIPGKSYGTFPYKSPETVRDNLHGVKSDIYCLGAVAWFLSLGKTPFYTDGERDLHAFRKFLAGGVKIKFAEGTSPELQDFIAVCMQIPSAARPKASELLRHPFITQGTHSLY